MCKNVGSYVTIAQQRRNINEPAIYALTRIWHSAVKEMIYE